MISYRYQQQAFYLKVYHVYSVVFIYVPHDELVHASWLRWHARASTDSAAFAGPEPAR